MLEESKIPWVQRHDIGFFRALWQTFCQVLLQPVNFFDKLTDDNISNGFSYSLILVATLSIMGTLISFPLWLTVKSLLSLNPNHFDGLKFYESLHSSSVYASMSSLTSSHPSFLYYSIIALISIPIAVTVVIFIASAFMHLFVIQFGGTGGFKGTFNVVAYSAPVTVSAVFLSSIIKTLLFISAPFFSYIFIITIIFSSLLILFAAIYESWIIIIGFERIHGFSAVRAIIAYVLPGILVGIIIFTYHSIFRAKEPQLFDLSNRINDQLVQTDRIKNIRSRCESYFKEYNQYPASLDDLIMLFPNDNSLEATSPSQALRGYYYIYKRLDKNKFTLYARPTSPGVSTMKEFYTDQTGVMREVDR